MYSKRCLDLNISVMLSAQWTYLIKYKQHKQHTFITCSRHTGATFTGKCGFCTASTKKCWCCRCKQRLDTTGKTFGSTSSWCQVMCSLTGCFFQAKNQTHCVLRIKLLITKSNILTRDVQPDSSTLHLYLSIFWGGGGWLYSGTLACSFVRFGEGTSL